MYKETNAQQDQSDLCVPCPRTLFPGILPEDNCIYDYATVLQELFKAGHDVGSHTWYVLISLSNLILASKPD